MTEARSLRPPRHRHIAFLNPLIAQPSDYDPQALSRDLALENYLFDFNYNSGEASRGCVSALQAVQRSHGLDFSKKTLLLAARGLDPIPRELFGLAHQFAHHHVFCELWNHETEVLHLAVAGLENVYFLPATANLRLPPRPFSARPNRLVFVSLGGDDEMELLEEVIRARPDLRFLVPDLRWDKDLGRDEHRVSVDAPNVTPIRCQARGFSLAYRIAYYLADTVLLATRREKRRQMRGGIRVADALRARKRLIMADNGSCELLMARHERTCLVTRHSRDSMCDALERVIADDFAIDWPLYEAIRALTQHSAKLDWIARTALDPEQARSSVFFRSPSDLARDAIRLGCDPSQLGRTVSEHALDALAGVIRGASLALATATVHVLDIVEHRDGRQEITLVPEGGRVLKLVLSRQPQGPHSCTTARGRALSVSRQGLSPRELSVVEQIARLL